MDQEDEHNQLSGGDSGDDGVLDSASASGSSVGDVDSEAEDENLFDQNGHEEDEEDEENESDDSTSGPARSSDEEDEEDDDENENDEDRREAEQIDRAELRKSMIEEQGNVAASIAQSNKADAAKGMAVKQQRKAFDSLLNCRIRLQQSLVATNSMKAIEGGTKYINAGTEAMEAAEKAALALWNTLDGLRSSLDEARSDKKRKRLDASAATPTARIWSHMQASESIGIPHRRNILLKWSAKTQAATAQPTSRRLNEPARQSTIVEVLNDQLSNTERLVKRTRMPRSCAPVQAASDVTNAEDIYDDADFYGVLLKELLEQRSIDTASNVQVDVVAQQYRAAREAKTKKNVDTKASKGRKMRYTVHEKIQNFMAPEDRGSWGERQIDELFGSLLGKRLALGENDADLRDEDDAMAEEEALMLFRS